VLVTGGIPADEVVEKIMLTEPAIKRLVEPAEVADLAVWLCGPRRPSRTAPRSSSTAAGPPGSG
jgi:3-hydroxybutyrate dehydrogenase